MKTRIAFFAAVGLTAGALLTGCWKQSEQTVGTPAEAVGEAKQEIKDTRSGFASEWRTFKSESQQAIASNEVKIDSLKQKMARAGRTVSEKYSRNVAVLEQNNRDLKRKLEEYKDAGEIKWAEFKTNFTHDMESLGRTMRDLFRDTDERQ